MPRPAPEPPRTPRQRQLIGVAARLFAERGYHDVGINDISGELGLTGPAFYRHFPSKEALLIAVLDHAVTAHLEQVRDLVSSSPGPAEALTAVVRHHVDFVFDQTETLMTWRTEFRILPGSDRQRLRYLQRLYVDEWVRTLKQLRPELGDEQLRVMCHAAIATVQSPTEFPSRLPRAEVTAVLVGMVTQALLGTQLPVDPSASVRA